MADTMERIARRSMWVLGNQYRCASRKPEGRTESAIVFVTLLLEGKMPSFYKRYVNDTLTIMPDITSAATFLSQVLNNCHSSVKFTMETESNGLLPFLGMQLLNRAPHIETKVYIKPTNTDLLLHYQSHVDMRYKRGLLKTMLDRAYRLSSHWSYCIFLKNVTV